MFLGRSFICFLAEGEMGSCTEACKCQCDDKKKERKETFSKYCSDTVRV